MQQELTLGKGLLIKEEKECTTIHTEQSRKEIDELKKERLTRQPVSASRGIWRKAVTFTIDTRAGVSNIERGKDDGLDHRSLIRRGEEA